MLPQSQTAGIERLYQEYQRPLIAHLTRLVEDRATAEDLLQDTFVKALRSWDGREAQGSVSAWLYRIATNTAYDHLRRRRRIRFSSLGDSEQYAPLAADHAIDEREPVHQALAKIPPAYRLPLVMHSYEGRSTHEIAEALGCSTSAVKTRLFRARERFRRAYES